MLDSNPMPHAQIQHVSLKASMRRIAIGHRMMTMNQIDEPLTLSKSGCQNNARGATSLDSMMHSSSFSSIVETMFFLIRGVQFLHKGVNFGNSLTMKALSLAASH